MAGIAELRARLEAVPRVALAHLPTPLEAMPRLAAALGGPRLWVKRDDCTGLGVGGNKVRMLEYDLAAALAAGADCVVCGGVVQSNTCRQVAAAATKLGVACHLGIMHSNRSAFYAMFAAWDGRRQRCWARRAPGTTHGSR
jgi:L-cysteate sulfo-lyase